MIPFNASSFYPVVQERWKNATAVIHATDATSLAGFDIKFPSKMPFDYNLQFAVVETAPDDAKFVLLFYSKEPITDSMRLNEFFKKGGIWITYRRCTSSTKEGSFDFNIPHYIRAFKKEGRDGYTVTINGRKGIASNQRDRLFHGVDIHDPSQVEFMIEETHIIIQAYLPKEDLLKIAESIN